jgi:hypothetical protein
VRNNLHQHLAVAAVLKHYLHNSEDSKWRTPIEPI